jgi:hypothetical protein
MPRSALAVCAVLATTLAATSGATAQQKPPAPPQPPAGAQPLQPKGTPTFGEAMGQYEAWIQRPSFYKRTIARDFLAQTGDVRALEIFEKTYKKPEEPHDRVRSTIVSLATRHLRRSEHLPVYAQWRAENQRPDDAWLWFKSLQVNAELGDFDPIGKAIHDAPSIWCECAAIQGLSPPRPYAHQPGARFAFGDPVGLSYVPGLLMKLPAAPFDRGMVAQACSALLLELKPRRDRSDFEQAANAVIGTLDGELIPPHSRLVVARHLARTVDFEGVPSLSADVWRHEFEARGWTKPRPKDDGRYAVTFAGIPASGTKLCYVVDCSDSMLTHLKKEKVAAPSTGNDKSDKKKRDKNDPYIPWDRIDTRFDLARELVLSSLRQLDESKSFAVVLFGDGAELMHATPGLVKADKRAVEKVQAELDAMKPGPATKLRPLGTLLGKTNLHGGLDRAFRVTAKGLDTKTNFVDEHLLEGGVDTIFVFTDGDPTWDDYHALDRRDPDDVVGDPESRVATAGAPNLDFPGPFGRMDSQLLDDVARMNLFRGVEIHCVGTGEAPMDFLDALAGVGLGIAKQVGQDAAGKPAK